jgi:hypothetical protein
MTEGRQWRVAGNATEVYERALVPAVFAPWAPVVVALADPRPGERVLDHLHAWIASRVKRDSR